MNDTGRVWIGSRTSNYGKPWVFGQFESCAIEAAKYILEISDLNDNALSNPVIVSRTFSKMSNSFDDDGILQGRHIEDVSYAQILWTHKICMIFGDGSILPE